MHWIYFIALLLVFELGADILSKEYTLRAAHMWGVAALGAYIIANVFWLGALRQGVELGRGALIFSVASAVLALMVGVVFYREELTRIQMIGAFIGVIALVFLFWES